MLVATAVTTVGLLAGLAATQLRGLRLGGVVVVPLSAVYTLYRFETLPLLVASVAAAYLALSILERRTLLYGRPLFVAALAAGALAAALSVALARRLAGPAVASPTVAFVGSVLPGIAAYNFHRLDPDRRLTDAAAAAATTLGLVPLGGLLGAGVAATGGGVGPPVLLSAGSDLGRLVGAAAAGRTLAVDPVAGMGVVMVGLACSEAMRRRWGVRPGGVVAVPLVALFSLGDARLVPLYLLATAAAWAGVRAVHRWTLLYGRALLSTGVAFGLLVAFVLAVPGPVVAGDAAFFVGVFAGVSAYSLHAVAPAERRHAVAAATLLFLVVLALARAVVTPAPGGLLATVGPGRLLAGGTLAVLCARECYRLEAPLPRASDCPLAPVRANGRPTEPSEP